MKKLNKKGIAFMPFIIVISIIAFLIIAVIGVVYIKAIFEGITATILGIVANPIVIWTFVIILFIWLLSLTGLLDRIIAEVRR